MPDPQPYGRTPWDFATEAIRSKIAISLVSIICMLVPLTVHFQAEPGTEITLFGGLIKYQKAKAIAPAIAEPIKTVRPTTDAYVLPKTKNFRDDPTPILDGTINLSRSSDSTEGAFYISGVNIDIASFGIRTTQGDAVKPKVVHNKAFVLPTDVYIELEYKGNFFVIETENQQGDEGTFVMTVNKLDAPTMKLKTIAQYASGG